MRESVFSGFAPILRAERKPGLRERQDILSEHFAEEGLSCLSERIRQSGLWRMISAIANAFSSTAFLTVVQNTAARVGIETTLKSVGRPAFILADKDIDAETKKYAATKEFAYQAICLGVYLALIPPIFKRGSFWLGKKAFGATHPEFNKFKS